MNWIRKAWTWAKEQALYLRTFEPSTLKGVWVALIALLGTIGISVSDKLDSRVNAFIGVLVVVVPILQGLWTRRSVVSNAVHAAAVTSALYTAPPISASVSAVAAGDAAAAQIVANGAPVASPEASPGVLPPLGTIQDDGSNVS